MKDPISISKRGPRHGHLQLFGSERRIMGCDLLGQDGRRHVVVVVGNASSGQLGV